MRPAAHQQSKAVPEGADKNACQAQPGHRIIPALPAAASNPIAAPLLIQIVAQHFASSFSENGVPLLSTISSSVNSWSGFS
jgi:hypothetical protein